MSGLVRLLRMYRVLLDLFLNLMSRQRFVELDDLAVVLERRVLVALLLENDEFFWHLVRLVSHLNFLLAIVSVPKGWYIA